MKALTALTAILCMLSMPLFAQQKSADQGREQQEIVSDPKISTFRENWILSELRSLRQDMMEHRNEMTLLVTDRELEVADKAVGYASSTVTYFFYLIAGAASVLALVGWSTIRDLKDNIRVYAEKEMSRLTSEYESRLEQLEHELRSKSRTIAENQEEIERTNEVHSLWLKASKEPSIQAKIAMYDQILELRPDDPEALAWKADAALELGEQRWALSLCDKVLAQEADNSHALYQRACAWADLGEPEAALEDLARSIELQETLRQHAQAEEHFQSLHGDSRFRRLLGWEEES
jgi:tetratricopeptide (TPR) repeat protein